MQITKRSPQINLTKELILQHVSEYDIVRAFWPGGRELKLNTGISSPFRKDPTPSFIIGTKYGPITYKDMGDYNFRGDVWNFVKQIGNYRDHNQVLIAVDKWFNLGYSCQKVERGQIITWEQPKIEVAPPVHIQVITRKFNKQELQYWSMYHQDVTDLKREHVYAPKEIYRNRSKLPNTELTFCYWCPDIEKWKIYRPLAPKKSGKVPAHLRKWDNSIGRLDYIENLDRMSGPVGICTKSRKDQMVIRKATGITAICGIQAEDPAAVSDEMLYQIWQNVDYKVCAMDNDKKGKEMSWWLSDRGYHHVNVPDNLLDEGITDFADMARYKGLDSVTNHMKEKWIV